MYKHAYGALLGAACGDAGGSSVICPGPTLRLPQPGIFMASLASMKLERQHNNTLIC